MSSDFFQVLVSVKKCWHNLSCFLDIKESFVIRLSGASGGGGNGGGSVVRDTMTDLLNRLPENFEMITMQLRAKPLLEGESGPFVVVALQVTTLCTSHYTYAGNMLHKNHAHGR